MGENRFATSVKAAKEKTDKIQEQKTEQEVKKEIEQPKTDSKPVETKSEKKTPKKDSVENASDIVSRRLNISDITDATQRVKKKGGRSRTFYMQDAMYDKLASVAEKQGIKPSQLLHAILDNVLDKM